MQQRSKWAFMEKEVLGEPDSPYLRRWRLLGTPWFNVWLHNIRRSDKDRDMHDHPFSFVSLILAGGYDEEYQESEHKPFKIVYRGSIFTSTNALVKRSGECFHRIVLAPGQTCWSLIFTGPKYKQWGFLVDGQWVHNQDYEKMP